MNTLYAARRFCLAAVCWAFLLVLTCELTEAKASRSVDVDTYVNTDSLLMLISNEGSVGRDVGGIFGGSGGTFYPYVSYDSIVVGAVAKSPLYAAGLWLGGKVNDSLRVALAEYSSEYWPGPMQGGTFVPGADTDSHYRVYQLHQDSLQGNPNTDYLEWPIAEGAPVDRNGLPFCMGSQTLWSVYNDANPAVHVNHTGSTPPLGIEIQQTVWVTDDPDEQTTVYLKYLMYNKGGNHIDSFYIGYWMDADLGHAEDDVFGCDTLDNIFYCYNGDDLDADFGGDTTWTYGTKPPAIGFGVVHGPVISTFGDSGFFNGYLVPNISNIGMTGFQIYGAAGDPRDPDSAREVFHLLQGLQMDGSMPDNGTRFRWPGDPVAGTGDIDTLPGEKKVLASFGPLTFLPGDSQQVVLKMAIGRGDNRIDAVAALRDLLRATSLIPTDVSEDDASPLPEGYLLEQNYPNPFNPQTGIRYSVPARSHVRLEVFNLIGQRVSTLVDENKAAGTYTVTWYGTDNRGKAVASGVYFYRLTAGNFSAARKMLLLK